MRHNMKNIIIIDQEYRAARAEYLNYISAGVRPIPVERYDKTRVLLHNTTFNLLRELNTAYTIKYGKTLISKDELQKQNKELVLWFKGAPRRK